MSAIVLQFVGASGASSELIEWFSQGVVSHVDAVLPNGWLVGARDDEVGGKPSGVQVRPPGYATWSRIVRVTLAASDFMVKSFYDLVLGEVGKPYDETAIATFAAGREWRDADAWFCSELQGAMLERCGYFASPLATPANKLTPAGLLLACSARVPVTMPMGG